MTETELKKQLKEDLAPVYLLYGEETYLSQVYADKIIKKAVGGDDLAAFNCHRFDGQDADWNAIEEAAEALPLMAERSCVVVRDFNLPKSADADRVLEWLRQPPASCVVVFYMDAVAVDAKKNAKWRAFIAAVNKVGGAVEFARKTTGDIVKLLCSGAVRRGCTLQTATARQWVEQSGDDLTLLLNDLDKLCALADGGEITPAMIESSAVKLLEAKGYDLSKVILQKRYDNAYAIIHRLYAMQEDPIAVLAVLAGDYANLYRAKAAAAAGVPAESLAADFGCKGREFRLRNAARDCRNLSRETLRKSLDVLADTDTKMKSTRADKRVLLEETVAKLILLAREGARA